MNNRELKSASWAPPAWSGQHFVKFLQGHPWFEITWLGASDRSAGKLYRDATSWRLDGEMPAWRGRT